VFEFELIGAEARPAVITDVLASMSAGARDVLLRDPLLLAIECEAMLCAAPASWLVINLSSAESERLRSVAESALLSRLPALA
jgi:hypothetical protein